VQVAWRMFLTGEVYRVAKATVVARKQHELQKRLEFNYMWKSRMK
jgi:hypothetical protein